MSNYPSRPFSTVQVTGFTPSAPARWQLFTLPNGNGIYEFHGLAIVRTVGIDSVSVQPVIALVPAPVGDDVVDRATAALAYNATPGGSALFLPSAIRLFEVTNNALFVAIEPSLFGDTFTASLRVRRVQ